MKYNKFNKDDFINDYFQMKALLDINGTYVVGLITRCNVDEKIHISIYDYCRDLYVYYEGNMKHIKGYYVLD